MSNFYPRHEQTPSPEQEEAWLIFQEGSAVLVLPPRNDMENAAELKLKSTHALSQPEVKKMAWELSRVERMDSSTTGVILGVAKRAESGHIAFSLTGAADPDVKRFLETSGLRKYITVQEASVLAEEQ